MDRLIFAGSYRLAPTILNALAILKPETVMEWHRVGFRSFWRWKSRRRGGRPTVPPEIRKLIREMSFANPLWGAPRIHGELLKLGIDVGQTSVAKYMVKRPGPPSQGWKTFLHNHADGIAAMDMFVVPTISLWGMADDRFCGLVSPRIRLQNGSQIKSRKHAAGNRLPAILSVTGMGLMVRYSSADFDQWAFAIDRHRRALHGKTLMLKG
jgi:hypothetical protein